MYYISPTPKSKICLNATAGARIFVLYDVPRETGVKFYHPMHLDSGVMLDYEATVVESGFILRALRINSSYILETTSNSTYKIAAIDPTGCDDGLFVTATSDRNFSLGTTLPAPWTSILSTKCILCVNTLNTSLSVHYNLSPDSSLSISTGAGPNETFWSNGSVESVKYPDTDPLLLRMEFRPSPGSNADQVNVSLRTLNSSVEPEKFVFLAVSTSAYPTFPPAPTPVSKYSLDIDTGYIVSLALLAGTVIALIVGTCIFGKATKRLKDQWSTSSVAVVGPSRRLSS
jgi:hypothetical protein